MTEYASTLLASRSSSNWVVDFYHTICNYAVMFSIKFQRRCWFCYTICNYVTGSCDTTCNYVRCYLQNRIEHFTWVCEPPPWGIHANSISRQAKTSLTYWYFWCSMVCSPPKAAIYCCTQNLGNGGAWTAVPTRSRIRLKHWNASSDEKMLFSDSTKTPRW